MNELPQALSQKAVNNFIGGLITEAGELTFPPDASVDELNCILERNGSRRRREGVAYEADYVLSTFTIPDASVFHNGSWFNVSGEAGKEFEVIQIGHMLYFYDKAAPPFSSLEQAQTLNLRDYEHVGSAGSDMYECSFTSVSGALVIANLGMDTTVVERNATTGALTASVLSFRTRDFTYLSDRTRLTEQIEPADALFSAERRYDTVNSGWGDAQITTWQTDRTGSYPPLTLPWFAGKTSAGVFSVTEWLKIQSGTSLIGNGKYILNFFDKNRSTASGIAGLPSSTETSRFQCITTYQNRVFYSGLSSPENSNVILFSKQLEPSIEGAFVSTSGLGDCFSVNDPTSEDFPDLLDTDGGEIRIPEAYGIKFLHPFSNRIFVFATNGVWSINGVDDVFKATGYSVKKISSTGITNVSSFVSAQGIPFWWSDTGIHTIQFSKETFEPTEQNISISSIQTYVDAITLSQKRKLESVYDEVNGRIYWAYPDAGETLESKLNNILVFDLPLDAFYPWAISDTAGSSNHVVGLSYYSGLSTQDVDTPVTDAAEAVVVDAIGATVTVPVASGLVTGDPSVVLLCKDGATKKITMATFTDASFLDWGSADFSSFAESGYDFLGDLISKKNTPYVLVLCRQTETGWSGDETVGYNPVRPSSLLISSAWNFKTSFSATQQAYRFKTMPVVPVDLSTFDYPTSVLETRLKLRGHGRSVRLRFESETGKDFHLLGYGLVSGRNNGY
jgi:hypothetical protein